MSVAVDDGDAPRMDKGVPATMHRRYKSACDQCHASKVKCPGGGPPCKRCINDCVGARCRYSFTARLGKPPGTRNKKTLERMRRAQLDEGAESAIEGDTDADAVSIDSVRGTAEDPRATSKLLVQIPWLRDLEPLSPLSPPTSHLGPSETANSSPLDPDPPAAAQALTSDFLETFHGAGPVELNAILNFPDLESFDGDPATKWNRQQTASPLVSPVVDSAISCADSANDLPFGKDSPSFETLLRRLDGPGASTTLHGSAHAISLCLCLSRYTRALSQLQAIEAGQQPVQADTLLASTSHVLSAAHTQLRCDQCVQDSRVALRLVFLVQTLFLWMETHCQPLRASWRPERVTLNTYSLTTEETHFVKTSLLVRAVEKTRTTLHTAAARLAQVENRGREAGHSGKMTHLETSFQSLIQSSDSLTQRLLMLRS